MKIWVKINKHFWFSFLLCSSLMFFVTSCKTGKEVKGTMKSYEAKELFSLLINNSLEYETFSGKMKASLRLGKTNMDVSASLKIKKDDQLQLSFQIPIIGGEAFRLSVSKDSIVIIDRINKQYASESIQTIKRTSSFDFDISNLQSLFTNRLFLIGKTDISMSDYPQFIIDQDKEKAFIKTKDKNINYTFLIDYTDHIRNSKMTGDSGKTTMDWSYDNFSALENKQLFPMQIGINLKNETKQFAVNFLFSKIDLDKELDIDFSIPKKYNRITLAKAMLLINSISQ